MKNFPVILSINVFVFLLLFFTAEFYVYKEYSVDRDRNNEVFKFTYPYKTNTVKNYVSTYKKIDHNEVDEEETGFRIPSLPDCSGAEKRSVVFFGCSDTYGAHLNYEDTVSSKLQKYTGRTVINRAFSGWGVQDMLTQLRLKDFSTSFEKLNPNIDYYDNVGEIIYIFIDNHIMRMYIPCDFFDNKLMLYKKDKNGKLKQKNEFDNLYWHSYILRKLYRNGISDYFNSYNEDVRNFLFLHFRESKKLIENTFPNARFTVFVFEGEDKIKKIEERLKKEDINIVYLSELSDIDFKEKKYVLDEANHPTAEVWDIIVPLLAKKLNL